MNSKDVIEECYRNNRPQYQALPTALTSSRRLYKLQAQRRAFISTLEMKNNKLECFGRLDQVFPMTKDGLRHSPERCLACEEKFKCLKAALSGKNQLIMEQEKLDRAYQSGRISFLRRWSKKKELYNRYREK